MRDSLGPIGESDIFDPPDYPDSWPAEQRVAAYWHALHFTGFPGTTQGWEAVWKQALREHARRANR